VQYSINGFSVCQTLGYAERTERTGSDHQWPKLIGTNGPVSKAASQCETFLTVAIATCLIAEPARHCHRKQCLRLVTADLMTASRASTWVSECFGCNVLLVLARAALCPRASLCR
jgi:hypothetical protein